MIDSVDIDAFRKLKSKQSNLSEKEPLQVSQSQPLKRELPPQSTHQELVRPNIASDTILKTWTETSSEEDDDLDLTATKRKAPLSFRMTDKYVEQLMKVQGRGVGSKVKWLLQYSEKARVTFKTQVSPLISILNQIDREINNYSSLISNLNDLRDPDGSKIYKLAKEASIIYGLIAFEKTLHGQFLNASQMKTLNFALGLSRNNS